LIFGSTSDLMFRSLTLLAHPPKSGKTARPIGENIPPLNRHFHPKPIPTHGLDE